jgi:hypothetical protein
MIAVQVDLIRLDAHHGKGMLTTIWQFAEQYRAWRELFIVWETMHRLNDVQGRVAQPVAILRLKTDHGTLAATKASERLLHTRENTPETAVQIPEVIAVLEQFPSVALPRPELQPHHLASGHGSKLGRCVYICVYRHDSGILGKTVSN